MEPDIDEKYNEFKEAINNDMFSDEYNLTDNDVAILSSEDIMILIPTLLDLLFDDSGNILVLNYEEHGVFPHQLIDDLIKQLKAFNDEHIREEIAKNPHLMMELVNRYFHCG